MMAVEGRTSGFALAYSLATGIGGDVNEVGAGGGREAAKDRGCQAIGKREAGGSHFHGHDFGKEHNHGAVVAAVNEGKPEFDGEQAGERRIAKQPQHGGGGGGKKEGRGGREGGEGGRSV